MPPPPPENATIAAGALRRRAASEPSPPITPSDGELLGVFTRDAQANEAAFAQLVDRHGPMVWRVCRQVLAHRQDAEDAFQATFLILARRATVIRSSESAAGWLYRVAHRTAIAARRKARRRKESRMETEPLAPPEAAFPDLAGRETAGVMMEELAAMPAKYRTPLVLRYLEGRSRREIADQTDTTIAAVQGLLARGKALLRGRLLRRGVSLSAAMMVVAGGAAANASESAPAQLIAQTTSNATAITTGGSVAASTAVVLLYREGVRAMFLSEVMKPVTVMTVALLLLGGAAIGAGENERAVERNETLTLDAAASAPAPPESVPIPIAKTDSNKPSTDTADKPSGEAYHQVYYTKDLPPEFIHWTETLANALASHKEVEFRRIESNNSFVIAGPQEVHEQIAEALERIRSPVRATKTPTRKEILLAHKKRLEAKLGEVQALYGRSFSRGPSPAEKAIEAAIEEVRKTLGELITEEARIETALRDANRDGVTSSKPTDTFHATIAASIPKQGAKQVDPDLPNIRVTFDRDMSTSGWSWTGSPTFHFPPIDKSRKPEWIDKRTCVLPVTLKAGEFYRVGINAKSAQNFKDTKGVPAAHTAIAFSTRGAKRSVAGRSRIPKVVKLSPDNGAGGVDPSLKFIRVTFDMPMGGGMSWVRDLAKGQFPGAEGQRARWSEDGRICSLPVSLEPGKTYAVDLNGQVYVNFQSKWGVPLEPVAWRFSTGVLE